jgi:hypothetical protein
MTSRLRQHFIYSVCFAVTRAQRPWSLLLFCEVHCDTHLSYRSSLLTASRFLCWLCLDCSHRGDRNFQSPSSVVPLPVPIHCARCLLGLSFLAESQPCLLLSSCYGVLPTLNPGSERDTPIDTSISSCAKAANNTAKLSSLLIPRTISFSPDLDASPRNSPNHSSSLRMSRSRSGRRRRSSSIIYQEPPESIEHKSDQAALPNLNANWVNAKGKPSLAQRFVIHLHFPQLSRQATFNHRGLPMSPTAAGR